MTTTNPTQHEIEIEARDRVIDALNEELGEQRRRAACLQEALKHTGPGVAPETVLFVAECFLHFMRPPAPARAH